MSEAVEQLRAAREILADRSRWTTGTYARNGHGASVDPELPEATCWCAYGALRKIQTVDDDQHNEAREALRDAAGILFRDVVSYVNDGLGHDAVLRMYDRAIELAEAQS